MRGLLIKDFKLMKNQQPFFLTILLLTVAFLYILEDINYVIAYMTIVFGMFTTSSISYDSSENGEVYLFTLPISKKGYVREKYIFGIIISVSALGIVSVISRVVVATRLLDYQTEDFISIVLCSLAVALFLQAYSIPIYLKYGAEKNRIATILSAGIAILIIYLIYMLTDLLEMGIVRSIKNMINHREIPLAGAIIIILAMMLLISYKISVGIMEKKEF